MITDEELNALLAPSNQPYTGKTENPDPISRELALTGQTNPIVARELAVTHGRFLSGLGEPKMVVKDEEADFYQQPDVNQMEEQDDVLGSGIFDDGRRPATVNQQMGVFEAHYSIPGPHAREVPFTINREITDISNGAAVVGIPSGGLNYVEHGDAIGYLDPTNRYEPYADPGVGGRGWDADSTLAPAEVFFAVKPTSRGGQAIPLVVDPKKAARAASRTRGLVPGRPARQPAFSTHDVASFPRRSPAGMVPEQTRIAATPTVYATQRPASLLDAPSVPAAEYMPPRPGVRLQAAPAAPLTATGPMNGFGANEVSTGTWLALLGAGVAAGVALRMFWPPKK